MYNSQNNNNNPFEVSNNQESASKRQLGKTKKKSGKVKGILLIAVILILRSVLLFSDSLFQLFEDNKKSGYIESSLTDNYIYNAQDFKGAFDQDPFPEEIPNGTKLTVTKDHEKFVEGVDETKLTFVVGKDLEPGVYTIKTTSDFGIQADLLFDVFTPFETGTYYNISLLDGAKIDLRYLEDTADFTTEFIPQTEYVDFEPGLNGIFVYGLSNFYSQMEFDEDDYKQIDFRYYNPDYDTVVKEFYYEEETVVYGIPGSYFIIEYED